MPRAMVLILAFLALAGCGAEPPRSPDDQSSAGQSSAGQSAPQVTQPEAQQEEPARDTERTAETTTTEEPSSNLRCSGQEEEEVRLGDFEPPESVPSYRILEERPVEREGAKAARLLVDTPATSEDDYALIARDIKYRYEDLDAVTVEFTDAAGAFSYNGGALIFNTPCGSDFIGYFYGPPNNEGYYVRTAD